MSDRTLAQLEKFADHNDRRERSKIDRILQLYKDLGLEISGTEHPDTISMALSHRVRRVVLSARNHPNPDEVIEKLCNKMRHVGGFVYNRKLADRGKANSCDTIEAHFPVPTRVMVRDILYEWLDTETRDQLNLILVDDRGREVAESLTRQNIREALRVP